MKTRVTALCLLAALVAATAAAAAQTRIKMATLVPEGSAWHKILQDMRLEIKTRSADRVGITIYPGGVAGDEPDVVRKMRIGQIQGATLTSAGLIDIEKDFKIFAVPLMFESYDEMYYVLKKIEPVLKERMESRGFVVISWSFGGWVYLFSKKPFDSPEGMKDLKIFVWAGDEQSLRFWKKNGYKPVPLASTDIMTGLETGMIDVLTSTPLASLALQWFRMTPYMVDLPIAPLMGANVITKQAWERISQDDRAAILDAGAKAETRTLAEIQAQDKTSIAEMEKRNVKVIKLNASGRRGFDTLLARFNESMRDEEVPTDIWDLTVKYRDEYRAARKP